MGGIHAPGSQRWGRRSSDRRRARESSHGRGWFFPLGLWEGLRSLHGGEVGLFIWGPLKNSLMGLVGALFWAQFPLTNIFLEERGLVGDAQMLFLFLLIWKMVGNI